MAACYGLKWWFLGLVCCMHCLLVTGGREGAFINYSERGTFPVGSDCKDDNIWCPIWAKDGECERNPTLPNQTCRFSCSTCAGPYLAPLTDSRGAVVLHTPFGEIRIKLLTAAAPGVGALVHELALKKGCTECHFYRNELPPESGFGPPYGLLQGSLLGLTRLPGPEGQVEMKRGHVAFIPQTLEFFISAMEHSDWGKAHIVWGWVDNMTIVDKILQQPYHEYKHPEYGTIMRMMNDQVKFGISFDQARTS